MSPRGQDRKAAILDAAVARIVAQGFEGLRVRDVAQDVGINNATLHHHFPTKADLVAAILQRFVAGFKVAGGVPDGGTLDERLAAYVAARRAQMRDAPDTFIVMNELLVLAARDAEVRRAMNGMQTSWQAYLVAVCLVAGADPQAAAALADRCRHELIGMGLAIGLEERAERIGLTAPARTAPASTPAPARTGPDRSAGPRRAGRRAPR